MSVTVDGVNYANGPITVTTNLPQEAVTVFPDGGVDIAEFLVWNAYLSDAEIATLKSSLDVRWNLTVDPFKSQPRLPP